MTDPATFVASALDAGAPGAAAAIGGVSVVALVLLGVAVAGAGGAPRPGRPRASRRNVRPPPMRKGIIGGLGVTSGMAIVPRR